MSGSDRGRFEVELAETRRYLGQTWKDSRQQFRGSPIHGIGSFASARIEQDEPVEIVGGVVMDDDRFGLIAPDRGRYNAIQIDEEVHLVELREVTDRRAGGSLNHSCNSNLWMADGVTLVARREIDAGEELTIGYAPFTVQLHWKLDRPCQCGEGACRRIITGNDWQLEHIRQFYCPHFSPFINRRIERRRADF